MGLVQLRSGYHPITPSPAVKNKYLAGARISEAKFRLILRFFAADVPALTVTKLCAANYRTIYRVYTLLRHRVALLALAESVAKLAGEVEVDESYFGPRRVRGKRGRGAAGKLPVIGRHKRGAGVHVSVVKDCSRKELLPVIRGHVLSASDVFTDGWRAYDGLVTAGFAHHRVHHEADEFARGKTHINGIESFWSFAKFRFLKLRGVRRDFFLLHLKGCEWRFNHRGQDLYGLLLKHIRQKPFPAT